MCGQVLLLPRVRLICPAADDIFVTLPMTTKLPIRLRIKGLPSIKSYSPLIMW